MRTLFRLVRRVRQEDDGATAVEYAVMLALILLACLAAIGTLGQETSASYTGAKDKINTAIANAS